MVGKESKIFIAGHRGLVGSAIVRALLAQGHTECITRARQELDLLDHKAVESFLHKRNQSMFF